MHEPIAGEMPGATPVLDMVVAEELPGREVEVDHGASPPPSADASVLERTIKGAGWVVAWRIGTRVLGLFNTLVLVHLLLPGDFGLVALATGLISSLDSLSSLGVEDVLIRERNPSRDLYDTGFTINLIRSGATALILVASSGLVGRFFEDGRLTSVMIWLAVGTIINGLENIAIVDFRRKMEFRQEFLLQVWPRVLGVLVTIATALQLHSYWALVTGILTSRVVMVVMSYVMRPYRPRLTLGEWRHLAGFSVWTWMIGMVDLVRSRSDAFLLGRFSGAAAVGIYTAGAEIAYMPIGEVVDPLCRACFSGFTEERNAGRSGSDTYVRILSTMLLFTLPAGFGISLVADPIVQLVLGHNWLEAIPLVRVIGVACMFSVICSVSNTLFSAHAMLSSMFRINLAFTIIRVGLFVLFIPKMGVTGAAIATAISAAIDQTLLLHLAFRKFDLKVRDLLRQNWRGMLATLAMSATLWSTGLGWNTVTGSTGHLAAMLAASVTLGAVTYTVALFGLWTFSGRETGPETDMAKLILRMAGGIASRIPGLSGWSHAR